MKGSMGARKGPARIPGGPRKGSREAQKGFQGGPGTGSREVFAGLMVRESLGRIPGRFEAPRRCKRASKKMDK